MEGQSARLSSRSESRVEYLDNKQEDQLSDLPLEHDDDAPKNVTRLLAIRQLERVELVHVLFVEIFSPVIVCDRRQRRGWKRGDFPSGDNERVEVGVEDERDPRGRLLGDGRDRILVQENKINY